MSQVTTGLRGLLSRPALYDRFQDMLGADAARARFCRDHVRAAPGDIVVDIGCGTAAILDHLPQGVQYHGFDFSEAYVAAARSRFGGRGTFRCRNVTGIPGDEIPVCQVAVAVGLLHHLEDDEVIGLMRALRPRLDRDGRFVTLDPAFYQDQSPIARFLVSRDRGRNVRAGDRYASLARLVFAHVRTTRRDDLLRVPYTHVVLECKN